MKYVEPDPGVGRPTPMVELTRYNLLTLLMKLNAPASNKTLLDPDHVIAVRAVPNHVHYGDRDPGEIHERDYELVSTAVQLIKEYRPTMDADVLAYWAADAVTILRALTGESDGTT